MADDASYVRIIETLLDLLPDVDVVLDVFQRCILGKHLKDLLNLLLRRFHGLDFIAGTKAIS